MLAPLPPGFTDTRLRLHRLAEEVLKPARERVNGRFGLRALPGGFGTPPFGDVMQVHVDVAIELGSEERGQRAAYGGSPGDEEHPEPYLYVAPWDRDAHELTEL